MMGYCNLSETDCGATYAVVLCDDTEKSIMGVRLQEPRRMSLSIDLAISAGSTGAFNLIEALKPDSELARNCSKYPSRRSDSDRSGSLSITCQYCQLLHPTFFLTFFESKNLSDDSYSYSK